MNDRFRFRVWNTRTKKLREVAQITLDARQHGRTSEISNMETCHLVYQPHLVLEQCTGLKDKNGRRIYEGDIVKYTRTNWYCPGHPKHNHDLIEINEIFWDEEEYSFRRRGKFPGGNGSGWIGSIKFHDSRADDNIIEVIGNIHENSYLLEGGK